MLSAAALEQRKKLQKRDNNFHTPGDNVIRHNDRTLLMGAAKGKLILHMKINIFIHYISADAKASTKASDRLNERMEKCKNLPRVIQFPPDLIHLDLDYKTEIKAVVTQVLNGPGLFMIKFTAMYEKLCYYGIMRMDKVIYSKIDPK